MKRITLTIGFLISLFGANGQDTFSIVAVDLETGEVGSAGASCVDLTSFPGFSDGFLGELFPGEGAINTQASYSAANQENARERFMLGDTPEEIIDWLESNDVSGTPATRQYGIVKIVDGIVLTAASSGDETLDYSNHVLGSNYSIQGNILLGQEVLDSMEARFLATEGDLACKLMAAMQGANMIGADSRCIGNRTSSLFAFLKVAQLDDDFGDPSLLISVRTVNGDEIEPIDSLQVLFNEIHEECPNTLGQAELEIDEIDFSIYPNPASDALTVESPTVEKVRLEILNTLGQVVYENQMIKTLTIDLSNYEKGVYVIRLTNDKQVTSKQFTKQ